MRLACAPGDRVGRVWYDRVVSKDDAARGAERKLRAAARRSVMTVEIVAFDQRKPSPYASSTPDERLAAAVRLIEHHQALRGGFSKIARSEWPGKVVIAGKSIG